MDLQGNPANKINLDRSNLQKKEAMIKLLSHRNQKLHQEIKLIEKAIYQKIQSKDQKVPKKRQSIIKIEQNVELLNRQRANCYKKIKLYQYQVNKYQKLQGQMSPGQRMIQIQLQIKQKKQISDKMKHQTINLQKQISDNAKKLGGNNQMHQNQKSAKQLNDQINFLKEIVKQYEDKQQSKQNQLKKQYSHIKKIENQYIQNGGSISEIDQLKQKAITSLTRNQKTAKTQSLNLKNNPTQTNNEEQIQDISKSHYQHMLNQINVLQKLNKRYQKQIAEADKSQTQFTQKNNLSRQKILDLNEKISELQIVISQQKTNILPDNLKPKKTLRSISTYQSAKLKSDMKNMHSLQSKASTKSRNLNHILKYQTVGIISKQGLSFTDRNILGEEKLQIKIIGLIVYVDKQNQLINGLQAIYTKNKYGGQHLKKDRTSKNIPYKEQHFLCESDDYVKTIGGTFNLQDKLQSLSILTNWNKKHSFGLMKNTKKAFLFQIQQGQFPACIFGSMAIYKDMYRQYSTIQYLGVQIYHNDNESQMTQNKKSNADSEIQQ